MHIYLQTFLNFLKTQLGEELTGLIVYGSYVRGYFDSKSSDYDVFLLFENELPGLKKLIEEKFPRISLQVYGTIEDLNERISLGGWSTYIVLAHTGKILYQNKNLEKFIYDLKFNNPFHINLLLDNRKRVIENLYNQTTLAEDLDGFELNKFLYSSLIKRFQLLHFIKTGKVELDYSELLSNLKNEYGGKEYGWLKKVETLVMARSNELIVDKKSYLEVLQSLDTLIRKRL